MDLRMKKQSQKSQWSSFRRVFSLREKNHLTCSWRCDSLSPLVTYSGDSQHAVQLRIKAALEQKADQLGTETHFQTLWFLGKRGCRGKNYQTVLLRLQGDSLGHCRLPQENLLTCSLCSTQATSGRKWKITKFSRAQADMTLGTDSMWMLPTRPACLSNSLIQACFQG
jgi:hypothetical protein